MQRKRGMARATLVVAWSALLCLLQVQAVLGQGTCRVPSADICFLVDASASVTADVFRNEKKFVIDFVTAFERGNNASARYSLVQYSSFAHVMFPLSGNAAEVKAKVGAVTQIIGNTIVGPGFDACRDLLETDAQVRVIVFLSDGAFHANGAEKRTTRFQAHGISVIALGAGDVVESELHQVATTDRTGSGLVAREHSDLHFDRLVGPALQLVCRIPLPSPAPVVCDACSYPDRHGKCRSVCPGQSQCVQIHQQAVCLDCGCFRKRTLTSEAASCCELRASQNGCRPASDRSSRTGWCGVRDTNYVLPNANLLHPQPDFTTPTAARGPPNRSVCVDVENFFRHDCACYVRRRKNGTKRCAASPPRNTNT